MCSFAKVARVLAFVFDVFSFAHVGGALVRGLFVVSELVPAKGRLFVGAFLGGSGGWLLVVGGWLLVVGVGHVDGVGLVAGAIGDFCAVAAVSCVPGAASGAGALLLAFVAATGCGAVLVSAFLVATFSLAAFGLAAFCLATFSLAVRGFLANASIGLVADAGGVLCAVATVSCVPGAGSGIDAQLLRFVGAT